MDTVPIVGFCYGMLSRIHVVEDKEPEMAKYTPNTGNVIQILIAAIITFVVLELLHVWG